MRPLLALPLLLVGVAAPAAGQDRPPGDFPATTAVPFVSQGAADLLLCGGAVGAMVLRAHGLRGVYADDFAPLVRPAEGGITTGDLARAIEARGMRVAAGPAPPDATPDDLMRRGPYVVLLEDGTDRYHYVVVVGVAPDQIQVHDPASGPDRMMDRADFLARWTDAGRWHLQPRGLRKVDDGARRTTPTAVTGATPAGVPADTSSAMARASAAFREGDYAGAARSLEAATALDARGYRLLAASLFLSGEEARALDVWDAAGGLTLDLVRVEGARRTRVPVLHGLLELSEGGALRRHDLERARRRLELAPSVAAGRVSYRPVDATTAEVEVAVVERPPFPSLPALAAVSGAALFTGSAELRASLTGAGESTTIRGRWSDAHRSGSLALAAPGVAGLPGVVTVEVGGRTERHPDAESEGRWGRVQVEDWATGGLRWWAGVGGERWEDAGPAATVSGGVELRPSGDQRFAGLEASLGGIGSAGYWTLRAGAGAFLFDTDSRELRGRVWVDAVGDGAPLALLPGAGTGGARDRLLRAHPLETGATLGGPARGRTLVGGTLEGVRWWNAGRWAPGLRVGLAAFVDGARPFRAPGPGSTEELMVNGGLGLRVAHPLLPGELRLDAAGGLVGGGTALSAGWSIPFRH